MKRLRRLDLAFCKNLTSQVLCVLPPSLLYLNMAYCYYCFLAKYEQQHGGQQEEERKEWPQSLLQLNLTGWENMKDEVLARYPLPSTLRSLNLTECYSLTNSSVRMLPRGLTSLDISWCSAITDDAILHDLPPALRVLYLVNPLFPCHSITKQATEQLSEKIQVVISSCSPVQKKDFVFTEVWK